MRKQKHNEEMEDWTHIYLKCPRGFDEALWKELLLSFPKEDIIFIGGVPAVVSKPEYVESVFEAIRRVELHLAHQEAHKRR